MGMMSMLVGANRYLKLPALAGGTITGTFGVTGAYITFKTNGTITKTTGGTGSWYTPTTTGIGNGFWIRRTITAGEALVDDPGTGWLALSSDRTYGSDVDSFSSTVLFEIATDSAGVNIATSGTYTLYVP